MWTSRQGIPTSERVCVIWFLSVVFAACGQNSLAQVSTSSRQNTDGAEYLFYRPYEYGSASAFTPISYLLNDGFDIFQLGNHNPNPWERNYRTDVRNVWDNLAAPIGRVRQFGTRDFISQEILPLSFSLENAQWAPNYELHIIGGGIAYRTLLEWYRAHGVPRPGLVTLLSVATERFVNELNENNGRSSLNVDPIADVYVFDVASVLLFQSRTVQRFFSSTLHATIWGKQPSITLPDGELHNVGQYYAFKWQIPGTERTYVFHHVGMGALVGLSRRLGDEYFLSLAGGAKSAKGRQVDAATGQLTIVPAASGAVFIDRNHSLLVSVQVSDVERAMIEVNVYPGVVPLPGTGAWAIVSRSGRLRVGLATRWGFGVGR